MAKNIETRVSGVLLHETIELTIDDVSAFCEVHQERVVALVEQGILEPTGNKSTQWRFEPAALKRAAKALRIQRDLELELAAVAVVLDLLDEIDDLRAELNRSRVSLRTD